MSTGVLRHRANVSRVEAERIERACARLLDNNAMSTHLCSKNTVRYKTSNVLTNSWEAGPNG